MCSTAALTVMVLFHRLDALAPGGRCVLCAAVLACLIAEEGIFLRRWCCPKPGCTVLRSKYGWPCGPGLVFSPGPGGMPGCRDHRQLVALGRDLWRQQE